MTYQVRFTETTNPAKPAITVADQTVENTSTSLTFVGKNYAGYATPLAENFLHLLENFASGTAPSPAVQGQLWYDNTSGVNLLKVYDGTTWTAAGSVKKASSAPLVSNSNKGDLWVDTENQQLYLFSGSNWLLVGPQYSSGLKTGPNIEVIVDTANVNHSVISLWSEDYRIAIISKSAFTPKASLSGFPVINQGINLSTVDLTSTSAPIKMWGRASQADALVVNGTEVSSNSFLRSDQTSTTNFPLNVRSNGGISIGGDLGFNISTDATTTTLYSKTSGNGIDIKVNSGGSPTTVIHVDATSRVGIGQNNSAPAETLDVAGNITTNGSIIVTGTADSTALGTGSIRTTGGLSVALKSNFGGDLSTYSKLYVNNLDINGDPTPGTVILPGSTSASGMYDIGSASSTFRNIYAESFVGNFSGTFTGQLFGSISGSAAKLASPTVFSITGDVATTESVSFDGQSTTGTAVFNTTITQDFVTSKEKVSDSGLTDELLIYRPGTGLKRYTKQTFISNIATMPVGVIVPFAGTSAPNGYLLCDGSEVLIADFPELFSVISYTYKASSLLIGRSTFALPDLRGRFALGRDNMDNGREVPSKDNEFIFVDAGGGSANRVTDVTADVIGTGSGTESKVLSVTNLPEHKHTLNSGNAQYWASGLPGAGPDANADPGYGMPNTSTGSGLRNSGGVESGSLAQPFNTMNPYQTINYIIFTGVL